MSQFEKPVARCISLIVADIGEKKRTLSVRKKGDDVVVEEENLGWFVRFEGSWESLFWGKEEPKGLKVGQIIDTYFVPR